MVLTRATASSGTTPPEGGGGDSSQHPPSGVSAGAGDGGRGAAGGNAPEWRERLARKYIEAGTGEPLPAGARQNLCWVLKDGSLLCRLMAAVDPNSIRHTVVEAGDEDAVAKNVCGFLNACRRLGMQEADLFSLGDLQQNNSGRVVNCLLALARAVNGRNTATPGVRPVVRPVVKERGQHDASSGDEHSLAPPGTPPGGSQGSSGGGVNAEGAAATTPVSAAAGQAGGTQGGEERKRMSQIARLEGVLLEAIGRDRLPSADGGGVFEGDFEDAKRIAQCASPNVVAAALSKSDSSLGSSEQINSVVQCFRGVMSKIVDEYTKQLSEREQTLESLREMQNATIAREEGLLSKNAVLEAEIAGNKEGLKLMHAQLDEVQTELQRKRDLEAELRAKVLAGEQESAENKTSEAMFREEDIEEHPRVVDLKRVVREHESALAEVEAEITRVCAERDSARRMHGQSLKRLAQGLKEGTGQVVEGLRGELGDIRAQMSRLQGENERSVDLISRASASMTDALDKYQKVKAENRRLYNQVQDLKGSIRVYVRIRPMLAHDRHGEAPVYLPADRADSVSEEEEICVDAVTKGGVSVQAGSQSSAQIAPPRRFTFDKTFGQQSSQEEVFRDMQPLVRSVLDGYNVCIFAYGQTGSGKTHTMMGPDGERNSDNWGVNYRALYNLFDLAAEMSTETSVGSATVRFQVEMVEIYNETIRDLLGGEEANSKKLEIKSGGPRGPFVPDLTTRDVAGPEDVFALMAEGEKNRAVGTTSMNERSSRSHSILTLRVEVSQSHSGGSKTLQGCLNLVDLAGSERVGRSEATGDRLKEAQHINKSLSALGDVISSLGQHGKGSGNHVPYRNSKLTHLLQDSLGGNSKTLMFAHVSPELASHGETMSTLNFAARVKTVEIGPARKNASSAGGSGAVEAATRRAEQAEAEAARLSEEARQRGQQVEALLSEVRGMQAMVQEGAGRMADVEAELVRARAEVKHLRERTGEVSTSAVEEDDQGGRSRRGSIEDANQAAEAARQAVSLAAEAADSISKAVPSAMQNAQRTRQQQAANPSAAGRPVAASTPRAVQRPSTAPATAPATGRKPLVPRTSNAPAATPRGTKEAWGASSERRQSLSRESSAGDVAATPRPGTAATPRNAMQAAARRVSMANSLRPPVSGIKPPASVSKRWQ